MSNYIKNQNFRATTPQDIQKTNFCQTTTICYYVSGCISPLFKKKREEEEESAARSKVNH